MMRVFLGAIALSLVAASSALAADIGVHAKIGALLGQNDPTPREAFVKGFVSHIALDYVLYGSVVYSEGTFINDDTIPLTVAVNLAELHQTWKHYKRTKNKKFLYGALGATAPDLIEVINKFAFRRDKFVFSWHNRQSTLLIHEPTSASGVSKRANLINAGIGILLLQKKF